MSVSQASLFSSTPSSRKVPSTFLSSIRMLRWTLRSQYCENFVAGATDVACADSENGVAGSGFCQQALDAGLHGRVVKNLFVTGFANGVAQRFAGDAVDGRFAGGVNIGKHQNVG